ncbi:heme-binding protein [Virgibacillus kekensis]|uniref:Heme-binding protein n=1 Tax=Virgibacillus kekensis TaxID=202261 RepID=A0ABV9DKY6_9BACI
MSNILTLDLAKMLISEAETTATEKGLKMTFAVVDEGGHLVALHRMDNVEWISVDVAIGKAYTAAAFKTTSEDVAKRGEKLPMFVNAITTVTQGKYIPQKGGLPIMINEEVVGAVGASGASGEEDVAVLETALDKVF